MVTVLPATVNVALRDTIDVFAATFTCTAPLPVPDAPDAIVAHDVPLVAVQEHPVVPVTDRVAVPPAAVMLCEVGETL
jgi:hypothetical protein